MTKNISDKHYVERDISWMYFNHRILQEAEKESVPLIDRLSDKGEGEENILTVDKLRKLHGMLSEMSVEKRMETYNLKPDRADVIVPAASIFLMVADHSGAQRILVPSLGLADGIINDLM